MKALLVPFLLAASTFAQLPAHSTPTPVNVQENIVYSSANGTELHLDAYASTPAGTETRPAVLLIHGGGWISFDKTTMRGMAEFLARNGFVCFAVDYRLFNTKENRWPAQLDDVQRAVRWVRANAAKYAVNPQQIGAFGHSAGAQLAALLGMEETRDNSDPAFATFSSKVQAVVDVSGPTDFTTKTDMEELTFLTEFFGTTYANNPDIWRLASPVFHVSKTNAPFLIVHGTQDESVPMAQAQELLDKLKAAGVPASLIKVNDVHTFRTPEARKQLALQTLAFLNRYLVPAAQGQAAK